MRGRRLSGPRWLLRLRGRLVWLLMVLVLGPALVDGMIGLRQKLRDDGETCRIVQVVDGDTVTVWCDGTSTARARLTGFDAPELFSPECFSELVAAQKSKWALRWMLLRAADLRMQRQGTDRYGRSLIALSDGANPLAGLMIAAGQGRAYDRGRRGGWCEGG